MCRLAAYVGPSVALSTLLYDAPHSLERQAYAPRELVSGHVNVDGTGIAWWAEGGDAPLVYVGERPPWSEPNLPGLAPRLAGAPQLAVVRSQTAGIPAGVGSAHPFAYQRWAGAHNGYIERFAEVKWRLAADLEPGVGAQLDVFSDSLLLFLLVISEVKSGAVDVSAAVVSTARRVVSICDDRAVSLNVVIADADEVVALRAARGVEPNSLYWIEDGARWPGARLVASEPLDEDAGWQLVGADHMLRITGTATTCDAVQL